MKAIKLALPFSSRTINTKSFLLKVVAGGFTFFLVKGILWLGIMAAIALGLL